ncbi:MAG TPA: pitrilysin family protein [Aliidongia sp.]|nr:pitrilysin family protein [Aliidongia sp.]
MRTMRAMRMRAAVSGLAALLLAGSAHAVTVETVTSPGGITAWLVEDHTQKVISLNFAIRGGLASDPKDKAGLSTFAMGLLDEGAGPYDSGQYQGKLEDLSASVDFSASEDALQGSLKTLSPTRDEVFELLRLGLTEPHFDAPAVERVRAEINEALDNQQQSPEALASLAWYKAQFPDHPYARSSYGTKAAIAAITIDDLKNFAHTRLGRDNLAISIVGDITPEVLKPLLDRTFGGLPEKAELPVSPPDVVPIDDGKVRLIRKPIPQSVIIFGERAIPIHDKDEYAALVLNRILGGDPFNSRLGNEVREKRGLAYSIGTSLSHFDHVDLIDGQTGTKSASTAETIAIIREEWAKLRDHPPTEAEIEAAKTYIAGSYAVGLESTGAIAARLLGLQQNGFPQNYFDIRPQLIAAVTVEDVKRVAARLLDPGKLTFVVVGDPAGLKPDETIQPSD